MLLNEILDNDKATATRMLRRLVNKKKLNNTDKAKATSLMAKLKAKRYNPKPGQEPVLGNHINDPFAGDTGSAGTTTVGPESSGANRY